MVAIRKFKVDYSNIEHKQLRREILLTLEGYTTNAICYWIILQFVPSWQTDYTDIKDIAFSYIGNSLVFNAWFYFSHRLWHSNRFLYRVVHAHHHESVIVCPLTALSNRWIESVWVSTGYVIGPYFFGLTNLWGWYLTTLSIVFEAILGHSRIPYTLEHATHHAVYNKNYGFYSERLYRFNFDKLLNTWSYGSNVPRMHKLYPVDILSYVWSDSEFKINWDMFTDSNECNKSSLEESEHQEESSLSLVDDVDCDDEEVLCNPEDFPMHQKIVTGMENVLEANHICERKCGRRFKIKMAIKKKIKALKQYKKKPGMLPITV